MNNEELSPALLGKFAKLSEELGLPIEEIKKLFIDAITIAFREKFTQNVDAALTLNPTQGKFDE